MKWKSDLGLEARMIFTMFLLAVVYLVFLAVLISGGANATVTVLFIGAFMFIQYFYSDKLVLWSMGAKVVSESEAPELHEIVTRLCITANLPKPRIAIINTSVPNALATGRSQKASVVAVTTGIMQRLNRSELEAVLAHELTHVKNRDAAVMTVATFLSSLAQLMVRWLPFMGGGSRKSQDNLAVLLLVSVVVWIISFILVRALSRYREFAADRGSAIITGQPSHLISALTKISDTMTRIPTQDLRRVEGANALFIVPALSGQSIMNLFSTHPSTEARIAALQAMERSMEAP
ncbi:MAG TPA: zinc metalloprotease HtpX [Methanotrichaceae archaeon]|nr:zinc metalloprotease HtpX [Methanotrichaceae archaeon]